MVRRGRKPKDSFADLPDYFRDAVLVESKEEIQKRVWETAIAQQELMDAKDADLDFQEAKERHSAAGAVYREGTKLNKLKIKFCKQMLETRG